MGLYFDPEPRKRAFKNLCCVNFTANHGNQELVLESPGLENISQLPGNRAEVDQNHDARNAVSATVSVLK